MRPLRCRVHRRRPELNRRPDHRQATERAELRTAFVDISYEDVEAILLRDPEAVDDADDVDPEQIFGAISVRSSGARYSDERIDLRCPALFFGLRRCVLVTWTPAAVEFDDVSGCACTEFIG